MSTNSIAVKALIEVLDDLQLYGREQQIRQSLDLMDFNAAVSMIKSAQQDNALLGRDTPPDLAGPVRRNAYHLAQVEARIAELAYKTRHGRRPRATPAAAHTTGGAQAHATR